MSTVVCQLCGDSQSSVEDAMEAEWIPFYMDGEAEGTACKECATRFLELRDGLWVKVKQ